MPSHDARLNLYVQTESDTPDFVNGLINVPFSSLARERGVSDLRGGNNNAPTRVMMNPSTMVGGYVNWTYFLNYQGTSPSERDCAVMIRKKPLEKDGRKVIYREEQLERGA